MIIIVKRITNPQTMETTIHIMMKSETMITVSPEKRNDKLVSQMETIMKRKTQKEKRKDKLLSQKETIMKRKTQKEKRKEKLWTQMETIMKRKMSKEKECTDTTPGHAQI
jgi:6-phosphofructokinase